MTSLKTELVALKRSFHFHPGNSNPQKVATWAALGLAGVIILGQAFGFVNYDQLAQPVKVLLDGAVGFAIYLFGRTHGKEVLLAASEDAPVPDAVGPAAARVDPVQKQE